MIDAHRAPILHPSPNFDARDGLVDMLVLHYTGMESGDAALARLCDPAAKVSAHYVVGEDGQIFSLVPETARAWHAGVSFWRGARNINARSIGIEIVNGGHDFGLPAFPEAQIAAVIDLIAAIRGRWAIPDRNIVGHSDVAPGRKLDPGERFPWQSLAAAGHGLWPDVMAEDSADPLGDLARIGYGPAPLDDAGHAAAVIFAFSQRFRSHAPTSTLDADLRARICAVAGLAEAAR